MVGKQKKLDSDVDYIDDKDYRYEKSDDYSSNEDDEDYLDEKYTNELVQIIISGQPSSCFT